MITPYRILCLSGVSGAGKTTLQEYLLKTYPEMFVDIPSYTTREKRSGPEPNYRFVTNNTFAKMHTKNLFAWTREIHGNWYGTHVDDLKAAFQKDVCSILIITPDCLPILAELARETEKSLDRVLFLHLWSPGEVVLRSRLAKRGDSEESIRRKMIEDAYWDSYVASLDVPLHFLLNNQNITYFAKRAEEYIFKKEP